jgi:transcription factor S
MKFCPLCYKILLIEPSTSGNRLVCKMCRYYYNLTRQQKNVITYLHDEKLEVIEENQEIKELPIATTLCPKCNSNKAYYEERQTRSADEAATIFFTCVQCKHKWNEN